MGDLNSSPVFATLQKVLERHPRVRLAMLFGSLESGMALPDSDLDLAVDSGTPMTADEKVALIDDVASAIGRPVDLIDLQTAGEPLLGQVISHGRRILGNDTHFAELIRKHVFDEADFMRYKTRILSERRQAWIGK